MKSGIHHSEAGVSLVEIMVALFIVGLASGAVMLVGLPASPDRLGQGAADVACSQTLMHLAQAKAAQFSGQPYGFDM